MRTLLRALSPGLVVEQGRTIEIVMQCAAVFLSFYIMWYSLFAPSDRHFHGAVFILFVLPFAFLVHSANKISTRTTIFDFALAFLAVLVSLYYVLNHDFYRSYIEGMHRLSSLEIGVGLALVVLTIEASRRCVGWGLTSVALVLFAYCAFGQYIPGEFGHRGISLNYFVSQQAVGEDGIFGVPLAVAATYAFLFIFFGTLYQYAGGGDLMFNLAAALTGRSTAGIPKSCVVSSGFYGSVSGSPVADVVTTGPITIPMMIKSGISAVRAGGVESAASAGGAFLPPVMGAVAFLMVEFTGLSYLEVVVASIAPALLYYLGVFALVHFEGLNNPSVGRSESAPITLFAALKKDWFHFLPIATLIAFIAMGYTASYVASASIIVVVLSSVFNRDSTRRIGPKALVHCCNDTLLKMVVLGAAVLCAGAIIAAIEMSGMTGKFSALLIRIAGDNLLGVYFASAFVLILLGMGMPTPAVYIMGVALVAPVLTATFQVPVIPAHMFILFFSCMSAITPPMAVACFASATIARAPAMAIGVDACRVGAAGFLIPFYLVYNNGIVAMGDAGTMAYEIVGAAVMVCGAGLTFSGLGGGGAVQRALRVGAFCGALLMIVPDFGFKLAGAAIVLTSGGLLLRARLVPKEA